jgi:hypothetical protein
MAITEIKTDTIEPFADGKVFGVAGSYMRIKGIAKGCAAGARSPFAKIAEQQSLWSEWLPVSKRRRHRAERAFQSA